MDTSTVEYGWLNVAVGIVARRSQMPSRLPQFWQSVQEVVGVCTPESEFVSFHNYITGEYRII